jgi:acyl-CoA reductase-like NAD-dependent aldehyde dehydrogenase
VVAIAPELLRTQAFVDGRWIEADDGATFAVVNPATGDTIADVPRLGAAETRRAIEAAARALPAWRARSAKDRARILLRLATAMAEREDELAALMVLEQGKPLAEARADFLRAVLLRVVRGGGRGSTARSSPRLARQALATREPSASRPGSRRGTSRPRWSRASRPSRSPSAARWC